MQKYLFPIFSQSKLQSFNMQRGFAMLEQSIAVAALLLLALAAFDLNKFLQAYQALEIGVESSLRKCYVTDGDCISPKDQKEVRLFKIWQKPIRAYEQDYTGNAWFLEFPNLRFPHPSARVLDSSLSSYMQGKGELFHLKYAAAGKIYYGLQNSELPHLKTFNPRQNIKVEGEHLARLDLTKHCSFHDASGRRISNLEKIGGTTSSSLPIGIGSLRCMIPSPFQDSSISQKISSNACFTSFEPAQACDDSWKSGTRIALIIEGQSHTHQSSSDSSGKIGITIRQIGNENLKGAAQKDDCHDGICDYGGRVFSGSGAFNFIPRGLPLGNVSESLKCQGCKNIKQQCNETCAYYKEFYKHNLIWVKYNQDFEVSFTLKRITGTSNDELNWNAAGIRIFLVNYEAHEEKVICKDKLEKSRILSGAAACPYALADRPYLENLKVHDLAVINGTTADRISLGISRCVNPLLPDKDSNGKALHSLKEREAYQRKQEQTATCEANGLMQNCFVDYDFQIDPDGKGCGLYRDSARTCPQNYGIAKNVQEEWDPELQRNVIKDNQEASSVCPVIRSEAIDPNARLVSTVWLQRDKALPPIEESFKAQNCRALSSTSSLDLPPPYNQYRNFDIGPSVIAGRTPLGLGAEIDPREEKSINSLYNCKEVSLRHISVQALNEIDYGCRWTTTAKALVQKNLQQLALLPSGYYFEPLTKTRSAQQKNTLFHESASALDACTDYQVIDGIEFFHERKYLGLYAAGSYPSACSPIDPRDPNKKSLMPVQKWCLFQSAGNMAQGGAGLDLINRESTQSAALQSIKTFFPAARIGCKTQSPYCVSFEGPELLIQDGKNIFQASASVNIPIMTFLGKNIPIRVSDSRIWEGEFAK